MKHIPVVDGIGQFRPEGRSSLAEVVDIVNDAIAYCRDRGIEKLLIDGRGLVGVPIPSLVDRFLMVEEWAQRAQSMVTVVLVVHPEYIHPEKFGVRVALDFGLTCDVYSSEADALKWLSSGLGPNLTTA